MTDEPKKIIVDDDWKAEAQREKERLAKEAEDAAAKSAGGAPDAGFHEILNLIVTQAIVGLGGMTAPSGERIPPNLDAAKYFIDLLDVLDKKTTGNLEEQEKKLLDQALYELRMQYVQIVSGGGAGGVPGMGGTDMPTPGGDAS